MSSKEPPGAAAPLGCKAMGRGAAPAARGGGRNIPPPAQHPAARATFFSEMVRESDDYGSKAPSGQPQLARASSAPAAHGAVRKRYRRQDLAGTDSSYLCLFCYEPLYVDINTAEEACFNRGCACYTGRGEISGNLAEHDGPRRVEEVCAESVREFRKFDRQFLLQKIHGRSRRKKAIDGNKRRPPRAPDAYAAPRRGPRSCQRASAGPPNRTAARSLSGRRVQAAGPPGRAARVIAQRGRQT